MKPELPAGLYVITDRRLCASNGLLEAVSDAIDGGAVVVQYRDKSGDARRRLDEAAAVAALCRERGVVSIVNDDADLARAAGADGVHLGRDDAGLAEARRRLGEEALIGVSCYDSLALGRAAQIAGCDYVAFGSAYASSTKPSAVHASLDLYRRAVAELAVPVVAIGGITPSNAETLIGAGCRSVAVISGVFGSVDVRRAAAAYAACFARLAGPDRLE